MGSANGHSSAKVIVIERQSNCTNGVVRSRGVGYEKCCEKERECS